ncbi:MAG: hypothetical protein QNK19_09885 [Xanthomonadales bacterium]|nr:hypothetical protein [Xanthomonadales bacterium]
MSKLETICMLAFAAAVLSPIAAADSYQAELSGIELLSKMSLDQRSTKRFVLDFDCSCSTDDVKARAEQLAERVGWKIGDQHMTKLGDHRLGYRNEKDPSASFEMDTRSGSFLFNGGFARYREDEETPGLPEEGRILKIALESLDELGLLPDEAEFASIKEGGVSLGVLEKDGSTSIYRKLVTLRITRQIDGLRVMGDSRIVVHLGADSQLAGLVYQWPEIGEGKELAPSELRAIVDLQTAAESRLRAASLGADRVDITQVELVGYDDGRGIIEPAFHVEAQLYYTDRVGREGKEYAYDVPFDFYVPIAKTPLAYYPSMERAPIAPFDGRRVKAMPGDNE